MKIIQNCSNQNYSKINMIDVLIWKAGLLSYKKLGYTTKIYCTKSDLQFLKDVKLLQYYDEIDDTTLETNVEWRDNINQEVFWALNKFIAIEHEFELGNEFCYSDTDIIINEPINFNEVDLLVWSVEGQKFTEAPSIYLDWKLMSMPVNYKMPKYLKEQGISNFNCGLVYLKNKSDFKAWKKLMLDFMKNNPGILSEDLKNKEAYKAAFMCNAEQRILTAYANHKKLRIKLYDEQSNYRGMCEKGIHFYGWRFCWKFWADKENMPINTYIALSDFVNLCLNLLVELGCPKEEIELFLSFPEISIASDFRAIAETITSIYKK